jgi:hypothetical protein
MRCTIKVKVARDAHYGPQGYENVWFGQIVPYCAAHGGACCGDCTRVRWNCGAAVFRIGDIFL